LEPDLAMKIRRRFAFIVTVYLLAFFGTLSSSHARIEYDKQCYADFPKWFQYFERRSCVRELETTDFDEKEKILREKNARICIAKDLSRMEEIAAKIKNQLTEEMTFEQAQKKLVEILETKLEVRPSEGNIKIPVAIANVNTKCNSEFHFLINVRSSLSGKIDFLSVWSKSPPKGYARGMLYNFSSNYVSVRREKIRTKKALKALVEEASKRKKRLEENKKRREIAKQIIAEKKAKQKRLELLQKRQAAQQAEERRRQAALPDHCAPGLNKRERLRRLALRGKVRQNSSSSFSTVGHPRRTVSFHYDGTVSYCQ
jgi:hypothetical protein